MKSPTMNMDKLIEGLHLGIKNIWLKNKALMYCSLPFNKSKALNLKELLSNQPPYVVQKLTALIDQILGDSVDSSPPSKIDTFTEIGSLVFLSHSTKDKDFVRPVNETLNRIGLKTWYDEDKLVAGDYLDYSLNFGVRKSSSIVFFISKNFVFDRFLKQEIEYAINEEREREFFQIIPILIDNESSKKIPHLLKRFIAKRAPDKQSAVKIILESLLQTKSL